MKHGSMDLCVYDDAASTSCVNVDLLPIDVGGTGVWSLPHFGAATIQVGMAGMVDL